MAGIAAEQVTNMTNQLTEWAAGILNSAQNALASLGNLYFSQMHVGAISSPTFSTYSPVPGTRPGSLDTEIGVAPDIIAIVMPAKPVKPPYDIPTVGDMFAITLPEPVTVAFPAIDINPPIYSISAPKEWSFNIGTGCIISDDPLVQAVIAKLKSNIQNGGTGLSDLVEADIWNRDLERSEQALQDAVDKATKTWAKMGFSLPDGMLANSIIELQKEYMNRSIDRSREISIKQAELEQNNMFKSIELANDIVGKVYSALLQYEDLVFKTQEAMAKYANEYIDLQIKTYMSMVEAYKATAATYEMIIRGELAKVEVYKTELEGQKLIGEINAQTVDIYSEKIKVIAVLMSAYETEVKAMVAELEAEKAKLEANKAQFDVWAKKADVAIAKYNGEVEFFKSESMVNISSADLYSKQAEAKAKVWLGAAELNTKNLQAEIEGMNRNAQMQMEAARGVAQSAAALASGAMAALSAHSSMTYNETMSGAIT